MKGHIFVLSPEKFLHVKHIQ